MPRRIPAPLIALASAFDARPWAGEDVCERQGGGPTITLPDFGPDSSDGDGLFLDCRHFLNGFSVEEFRDLGGVLTAGWGTLGGAGTIGATIGAHDRVEVTNGGAVDLILEGNGPGNARWGVGDVDLVVPAGTTVALPNDWRRGVLDPEEYLILTRSGGGSIHVPVRRVDDARIALRPRGGPGDLDDDGFTLQSLDPLTWWGIERGRVWWATTAATTGMDWLSTTFRDRLGFTGDEELTVWGDLYDVRGQIADRLLPGWVEPSRPLRRQRPRSESIGATVRLIDGSYASSEIGDYRGWTIEGWIDGLQDVGDDLHRHYLDLIAHYAPPGWPLTLYQDVGESRRTLDPRRATADRDPYDLLYTSEVGGYRGRILCRVNPASKREVEIEADGPFRRRHPFELVLDEREDGV